MTAVALYAADLVAITILTFAVYFPRHRRRDLVVAYLGVNVGVLAVSAVLTDTRIGVGLGLGLFGVLSIIRLRSYELDQHEVAFYFSSLAIGVLGGLGEMSGTFSVALMALIVGVMYVAGHPRLFRRYRQQTMVLDAAFTDEAALVRHLEQLLGARVHALNVQRVDMVNDSTRVDVRFQLPRSEAGKGAKRPLDAGMAGSQTGVAR
jgi:hypothetical protein